MPTSDPIALLLKSNDWANRQLLNSCESLNDAQFHQRFDIGPGSLHDTLTHIIGAMRGWGDLIAGREQRPRLEADQRRSVKELQVLLDDVAEDFAVSANSHPQDEVVTACRGGREYSFTRGAIAVHVTTHGMHHRAQCLNMLKQLGIDPLPPSSVMEWTMLADSE